MKALLLVAAVVLGACASDGPPVARARGADDIPIVLAHGLSGFRSVSGVDYFFRVPSHLRDLGFTVYVTHVPPWASVATRAEHLSRQIDMALLRSKATHVHVIAHSMGGLDSRFAISRLGAGSRIASLTTVGTPHRGTVLADDYDRVALRPIHPIQDVAADFWIWNLGGIKIHSDTMGAVRSLSETNAEKFNQEMLDDPRVRYYSFAGRTLAHPGTGECDDGVLPNPAEIDYAPPELLGSALLLAGNPRNPAANDGLVSVKSAKWGVFMGCLPADHLEEVGQPVQLASLPGRWDHKAFYAWWAQELTSGKARGYGVKAP